MLMDDELYTKQRYADPWHRAGPKDDQPLHYRKSGHQLPEDDPELDALGNSLSEEEKKDIVRIKWVGPYLIALINPFLSWRVIRALDPKYHPIAQQLHGAFLTLPDVEDAIAHVVRNKKQEGVTSDEEAKTSTE
jgi:hypothetical protein